MTDGNKDKPNQRTGAGDKAGPAKPEAAQPEAGKTEAGKTEAGKTEAAGRPTRRDGGRKPPAEPAATRRANGGGRGLGGLALLLAVLVGVGGAGGGWYLWQQIQALRAEQDQLPQASQLQNLEQQIAEGRQARQRLEQQLTAAGEQLQQGVQQAGQNQGHLAELRQNQEQLQRRLREIGQLAETSRDEWIRSEAAYLANIAKHRLQFHRDVDAALAALKAADDLLAQLGAESLVKRRAIKQSIDRLLEVKLPDYDRVAEQLVSLIDVVPQLPLAAERLRDLEQQPEPQPAQTEADGWRARLAQAWERFKASLEELVVIRRDNGAVPLVAPKERYFLRQTLILRLETARLALVQGDGELYRDSLQRVEQWLRRYYAVDAPTVVAVLEELQRLQQVRAAPDLPDIAPLLEPLKMFE